MFRAIGNFIGGLWRSANFWRISPIEGVRTGSPLAGALLFLFLLFCVIGVVLFVLGAIFGFGLSDVDAWIARQGGWLDLIGKIFIQKVMMAVVLLFCVLIGVVLVFFRDSGSPGWLMTVPMLLVLLFVGYCSTVNIIAPLDPYDPTLPERYTPKD